MKLCTRNSGGTFAERMRVASGGDVTISDGNLVIGTAGHGIDFSATSDGTTMSSEILDNYEEGLWDATLEPQTSGSVNMLNNACQYTKIGSMVYLSGSVSTNSASSPVGVMKLGGFPYAISNLTDLAGRSIGTINIQAAAITPVLYGLWLEEGDSFAILYNFSTSSEQPAGTAANNFSGNETIYFSIMYRTS